WQHRLNPVENLLGAGCNLTRPAADLVRRAGFRFEELREFHDPKMTKLVSWITTGVAVPAWRAGNGRRGRGRAVHRGSQACWTGSAEMIHGVPKRSTNMANAEDQNVASSGMCTCPFCASGSNSF